MDHSVIMAAPLHVKTPLLYSVKLSKLAQVDVYLKMENVQPSGSFKLRGCGYRAQKEVDRGCTHLVTASGGNCGQAVARAAAMLGVPATVYIPKSSPDVVREMLESEGAKVFIHGVDFGDANKKAIEEGDKPGCVYIHPFMHHDIWEGHSSLIDEVAEQLPAGTRPGCVVVAVGGGGLLQGCLVGMERHDWMDVPVLALETRGADCLNVALANGRPVDIEITSIAHTLGARSVLPELLEYIPRFKVTSHVVSDFQAVSSVLRFADDHRVLVEPACGAALAAVYCDIVKTMVAEGTIVGGPVVLVVCGGTGVSMGLLQTWAGKFGLPFP